MKSKLFFLIIYKMTKYDKKTQFLNFNFIHFFIISQL